MRRPALVATLVALVAISIGVFLVAWAGRLGPPAATEASPTAHPRVRLGQPPLSTVGPADLTPSPEITVPDHYGPPQAFMEGIYAADRAEEAPTGDYRIRAVVVPHHLVAATTTALGIRQLVPQRFGRVLLLSPDHFDRCPTLLCTADVEYQTAFGPVRSASATLAVLKASPLVTDSPELFRSEHGVHAVVPFLAHYRPGAPVTPLVLSQRLGWKGERQALLDLLDRALDADTVLVVSSDFSHYLPLPAADAADEQTAETLFAKDLAGLAELKQPDQSDCPGCLWATAALADRRGFYNPSVLAHTNSARLLGDLKTPETTSHFALAWYENARLDGDDLAVGGDVTVTRGRPRPLNKEIVQWWSGNGPRLVNLEGPLAEACVPSENVFMFCNRLDKWSDSLRNEATHFVTQNNHMLDLGAAGLDRTSRLIESASRTPVGTGLVTVGPFRVMAYSTLMNPVPEAAAARLTSAEQFALAAPGLDQFSAPKIAYVHGGIEYRALATDAETARWKRLIDAGADAVIVVHSHVPGDVLIYKGKPIFRGLGNFRFDQYDRIETMTAKLVRLRPIGGLIGFETFTGLAQ